EMGVGVSRGGDGEGQAAGRAILAAARLLFIGPQVLAARAAEIDRHGAGLRGAGYRPRPEGARNVFRKSMSWDCSRSLRPAKRSAARVPWPPCMRIASSRVAARPSCRYGAESATPQSGGGGPSDGWAPPPRGRVAA